ncbi:hypothetical protein [Arthrobacter castelli]|uniref:hypothetical protein n=1 Tax=Arthrobacter castelli TaxID=271431 RepID=UPI0004041F03|nr:hypothetical protein [Arthrobacter castelli]
MDLQTTADELYSLLPGDFTATRNARATEANRAGDKELGKQIRALPKPSMAAWLVNMLVRRRLEEIGNVLELGASLRQAQEDLDQQQLRELGGQRHELLAALVEQARSLADELDQKVSDPVADDVEQTLHAAMADADAAAAVSSGTLTRSLSSTGFEPVDLENAVAVPEPMGTERAAEVAPRGNQGGQAKESKAPDKDAESDLEQAEQRVLDAESRQQEVEEQLEEADQRQEKLAAEIDELKTRLHRLERERKDVDAEVDRLERDQDEALHGAKDARRDAGRARRRTRHRK